MRSRYAVLVIIGLGLLIAGTSCRRESSSEHGMVAPTADGPARFPALPAAAFTNAAAPAKSIAATLPALTNGFSILQSELTPAVLVHSETPHLTVFGGLTNHALGAPKFVAWATRSGPRTFQRDEALDVSVMAENWVLVWWAGAAGWTNWDCPWVLYLQHKPDTMSLDVDGLHLDFPTRAGSVVMMPLYGYEKLPLETRDFRADHKLPTLKVPIKTWEWAKVIPRDPLTRARYWGAALREFPVAAEESFTVDLSRDALTIHTRIQRLPIADDWRGRRFKLAPISPTLALAAKAGRFPVEFSERWFDLEMPTSFGPSWAVQDVDEYSATLPLLRYVNSTVQRSNAPVALGADATVTAESLWAYVEASGDSAAVQRLWPRLKEEFQRTTAARWAEFSQRGSNGQGSEPDAVRALAFARLAHVAGDGAAYSAGCLAVVRALTGVFAEARGMEYFHEHQPWHAMDVLHRDETRVRPGSGDATGWQFARGRAGDLFHPDLTWFIAEHPGKELRRVLASSKPGMTAAVPSSVTRLFPAGGKLPAVAIDPRSAAAPSLPQLVAVRSGTADAWPELTWPSWLEPARASVTFGEVRGVRSGRPGPVRRTAFGANGERIEVEWRK